jgi:V/A-type H+/Na+-transporting ATPase subunit C
MSAFDYGNARLRAMKSRLLSRQELEALTEVGSLRGLIAALTKTPYRKPVETALARTSGMDCIASALRDDLVSTLGKIPTYYMDEAAEMVVIVLRKYDIHNLKAILRGLANHISPAEILSILIPVGELKVDLLAELARAPDPRAAIDLLASTNSPFAQPLLDLRTEHPGADLPRLELALEKWSFSHAKDYLESERQNGKILSSSLDLDADLTNLLTVLRFAQTPQERKLLGEWLGIEDLYPLMIGPGSLSTALLVQAGMQDTLDAAVETFAGTVYESPLRAGLEAYTLSGRLSELERQLRRFQLKWTSDKILSDPLGIGVVMGFSALKVNEIGNLRWIAQGINLGLNPQSIRENLEFA